MITCELNEDYSLYMKIFKSQTKITSLSSPCTLHAQCSCCTTTQRCLQLYTSLTLIIRWYIFNHTWTCC